MPRFDSEFNPILLEGMTATLFGNNVKEGGMNVACVGVGALPEYQKDFSSLTAATWERDKEDTNLEMGGKELAQFRMRVLDDFKLQIKHPSSVSQWRTNKVNFFLRQWLAGDDVDEAYRNFLWKASEFFVFENTTPRFDVYSENTQSQSRVSFSGWRFKLREIQEKGRIVIWVDSWPGTTAK